MKASPRGDCRRSKFTVTALQENPEKCIVFSEIAPSASQKRGDVPSVGDQIALWRV